MADLNLTKEHLPFLLNGIGTLHVAAKGVDLMQPIKPSDDDLAQLTFSGSGAVPFTVAAGNVNLGIDNQLTARLLTLWPGSSQANKSLLQPYGLENYFDSAENQNKVLLLFLCGESLGGKIDAKFAYTDLSAEVTLSAGADASYALLGVCDQTQSAEAAIIDFFKELKLPSNIAGPLPPDEVIAFGYGGSLKLGAAVGFGYEIAGGHSLDIGTLALSEKYDFSLAGKVTLGASVAGRFNLTVYGKPDGWARVVIHKNGQKNRSIAADVTVGATSAATGLPDSSQDFISAVVGIKAKNWINLFNQARDWTDFDTLKQNLDHLAQTYIEEYIGKGFTALQDNKELNALMARFKQVVDAYNNAGNDAVTLFDRYFDVAKGAVDDQLNGALTAIKSATSWDDLKSKLNSGGGAILWEVVNQLTKGDPLGWILGQVKLDGQPVSLDSLKGEADKVMNLVEQDANSEIVKVIALAKSKFPLDKFLTELNGISWDKLQTEADEKAVAFAERLIGKAVDKIQASEVGDAINRLHATLTGIQSFTDKAYSKFREVLNQTLQLQLHAGYNRADANDTLVDAELNLNTQAGKDLMKQASRGNFSEVLQHPDPSVVRNLSGTLTESLTKQSTVSVDIKGWHLNWHYDSLSTLIVEADQHISSDNTGSLTIDTTFTLTDSHQWTRNGERTNTNLLLNFIGLSKGKVPFDEHTERYLVNAITDITARYDLGFDDPDTKPKELADYVSFADELGLASPDNPAMSRLAPLLVKDAKGNYGHVTTTYDVRFTQDGLKSLFGKPFTHDDAEFLRKTARRIVLLNALKTTDWPDVAWCYWSDDAYQTWLQLKFTINNVDRSFKIDPSPLETVKAKDRIKLNTFQLRQLHELFSTEESLIAGMVSLSNLVRSTESFTPKDFKDKLSDFGDALKGYDDRAFGQNATFALFDQLIQRAGGSRNSSLTLTAEVAPQPKTTKMLIA